ncbi:MAG: hypothetical protein WKG07_39755 [Hymenobacter sp.]
MAFEDAAHPAAGGPVSASPLAQVARDAAGAVSGLLLFAYNVSAHVRARQPAGSAPRASTAQQLATANERLAVVNEELDVTNEELQVSNEELQVANHQLQTANKALRTQADELRRAERAVRRLNDELVLTNAGLEDTITDSLRPPKRPAPRPKPRPRSCGA